jgi:hypothetical protein
MKQPQPGDTEAGDLIPVGGGQPRPRTVATNWRRGHAIELADAAEAPNDDDQTPGRAPAMLQERGREESKAFLERLRPLFVDKHGKFDQMQYDEEMLALLAEVDPKTKAIASRGWNAATCLHEAGHATAAARLGMQIRLAAVDKGRPRTRVNFNGVSCERAAVVCLAGEQAAASHAGRTASYRGGSRDDWRKAVFAATGSKPKGMELATWMVHLAERAKRLVTDPEGSALVKAIARHLLRHGSMTGAAIQKAARRVMVKTLSRKQGDQPAPQITVNVPAPVVNAPISINVPKQEPQAAPQVVVNNQVPQAAPPVVNLQTPKIKTVTRDVDRGDDGRATGTTDTYQYE